MTKKERMNQFMHIMINTMPYPQCKTLLDNLSALGFFDAPASTKYHGNYPGGLYDHSVAVTRSLVMLTKKLGLQWERPQSPYLVGMFHDLCKCDQYMQRADGTFDFQKSLPLTGHGDKSVIIAQHLMPLTEEEVLCIRWHMGAYDDQKVWNNLGVAIEKYPNVLFTHTADMIASKVLKV